MVIGYMYNFLYVSFLERGTTGDNSRLFILFGLGEAMENFTLFVTTIKQTHQFETSNQDLIDRHVFHGNMHVS